MALKKSELAAMSQEIEELAEEHGSEGGLLEDAKNDKDKLTKASAAARLKEIRPGNAKPQLGESKKMLTIQVRNPPVCQRMRIGWSPSG